MKNYLLFILIIGVHSMVQAQTLLADRLKMQAESSKASPEQKKIMQAAIADLTEHNLGNKAPKVGDVLPNGNFVSAEGASTSLYDEIGEKKAIVTFYRGSWCPYCNLQLHMLQEKLPEITETGAVLVAVSPELPDNQLSAKEKAELKFRVLSDTENAYAEKIHIVFPIGDPLKEVYQTFGIDLEKFNGIKKGWTLPLAATFVLDENKKIIYRFIDADYKKRAEPDELLKVLKE